MSLETVSLRSMSFPNQYPLPPYHPDHQNNHLPRDFLVILFLLPKASYKISIQEEIQSRLNSENAIIRCSVLHNNIQITRIYRTIILPVVLKGCEIWSFTLMEEYRLRLFDNRMLRRIFGPKRGEVTWEWIKLHIEGLMICTAHQILFGWSNREE